MLTLQMQTMLYTHSHNLFLLTSSISCLLAKLQILVCAAYLELREILKDPATIFYHGHKTLPVSS